MLCRVFYKSRGLSSKPTADNCYDDTGSSSLPALMDSFISFEHNPLSLEGSEQVPCFSNYAQAGTSSSLAISKNFSHGNSLPDLVPFLNPLSSEKKAFKAVIDHLTKMGSHMKSEPPGHEGSSDMWTPF